MADNSSDKSNADRIPLPDRFVMDNKGQTYISVQEYMKIKLERNRVYVKFLTLHNELLRKEIVINYRTHDMNKKKIETFEEIDQIERQQSVHFLSDKESKVTKMYADVNSMVPKDYDKLQLEIDNLRQECLRLRNEIDSFNDKIPRTVNIIGTQ